MRSETVVVLRNATGMEIRPAVDVVQVISWLKMARPVKVKCTWDGELYLVWIIEFVSDAYRIESLCH